MVKGDINYDGLVTEEDLAILDAAIKKLVVLDKKAQGAADLTGDRKVTVADLNELRKVLSTRILGDVNGDGMVTEADLKALEDMINGKLKMDIRCLSNADISGDGKVDRIDLQLLKKLMDAIIKGYIETRPKNNKVTINLGEFEKGEYLSWFVTTQASYEVTMTLRDDKKIYFKGTKKELNIAPPLAVGNDTYTGTNLRLEISIPESEDIKVIPSMTSIITNTGKVVGHSFTGCGEDWNDADYNDFYINIVGWKSKK